MKKKSILMIVAKYPPDYGHYTVINQLCRCLNKFGHKAAIGAFTFEKDPPYGIEKVILKKSDLLKNGVKNLDYDIIHPHQPRVLYYLLLKNPNKPIIFHYHAAPYKIQEINLKLSMSLFKKKISKIICVSKKAQDHFIQITGPSDSIVIYNGVDTEFYNPNLEKPFKKGEPELIYVSVLRKYKRAEDLVDVMPILIKKYPKAHLQIVGGGEQYKKIKEMVKEKHLEEYVEIAGVVDDEELRLRYSSSDIFVSASTHEHCPVPPFEAMASGKPLVLSSLDSHKEILGLSDAGLTYRLSEKEDLCQKIDEVYQKKDVFSENALQFVKEYDWLKITKQVEVIYEQMLEKNLES